MKRYALTLFQIAIISAIIIWSFNVYFSIVQRKFGVYFFVGLGIIFIGLVAIFSTKKLRRIFGL